MNSIIADKPLNDIFNYSDDSVVRVIGNTDDPWFNGKDIATILGYVNTKQAIISNVDEEDKSTLKQLKQRGVFELTKKKSSHQSVWINRKGVTSLLTKSRMLISDDILNYFCKFNIFISRRTRYEYKETETIGTIVRAFKGEEMEFQKTFGNFRVDLFFPDYSIFVECDENGHKDRDQEYEESRENWLRSEVKDSVMIRYNPDVKDFNIIDVINKIFRAITLKYNLRSGDRSNPRGCLARSAR